MIIGNLKFEVYLRSYNHYCIGLRTLKVHCCDMDQNETIGKIELLGGLSLHLNHLIASRTANYNWPFGTLPFGLFGSNLDTRDLGTYPRTYSGHFLNMSIFDDSRAI